MEPSGAGKSIFLDAIAGRIARGNLQGSARIDGKPVGVIYDTSHSILKTSDIVQQHGYM